MTKAMVRGGLAVAVALVNWFARTDRTAAAACWGHGVTCGTETVQTGCPPFPFDPTCPSSFQITVCKPGTPAWTWCVAHNNGSTNQWCDLGEICTC